MLNGIRSLRYTEVVYTGAAFMFLVLMVLRSKLEGPASKLVSMLVAADIALLALLSVAAILSQRRHASSPKKTDNEISVEHSAHPPTISTPVIHAMEWRSYLQLCRYFWQIKGYATKTFHAFHIAPGVGGFLVRAPNNGPIVTIVITCPGIVKTIGNDLLSEIEKLRQTTKAPLAILAHCRPLSEQAKRSLEHLPRMKTQSLATLNKKIAGLSNSRLQRLNQLLLSEDYQVPTCPTCQIKMRPQSKSSKRVNYVCERFSKCEQSYSQAL